MSPSLPRTWTLRRFLPLLLTLFAAPLILSSRLDVTTFSYPSFNPKSTTGIVYSGDASASSDGVIELTKTTYSSGRAVYAKPIHLHDRANIADFVTHFTFVIDSFNNDIKADGITFFLARTDYPALDKASTTGETLGLMNETLKGLASNQIVAVEFDTYINYPYDPVVPNHMGIDVNSYESKVTVPWQWDAKLGKFYGAVKVWYNSGTKTLSARLKNQKNTNTTEYEWKVSLPIDLRAVLPERVVVGFTGATGAASERNQISSWKFSSRLVTAN